MAISRSSLIVALFAFGAPALVGGCFALFSLDEYGPNRGGDGGAEEAGTPGDASVDGGVDAAKPPRVLFVTTQRFNGSMAGASGADNLCTAAAADAGLDGSFVAWLGAGTTNGPASRIPEPQRQIVYANKVVAAANLAELAATGPRMPILVTETNVTLAVADCADDHVWTNARANGTVPDGGFDCTSWSAGNGPGAAGQLGGAHDEWTDGCGNLPCALQGHLYCFQK